MVHIVNKKWDQLSTSRQDRINNIVEDTEPGEAFKTKEITMWKENPVNINIQEGGEHQVLLWLKTKHSYSVAVHRGSKIVVGMTSILRVSSVITAKQFKNLFIIRQTLMKNYVTENRKYINPNKFSLFKALTFAL